MSTKQLYLVIRLPRSSSTSVPLPISSQLSIRLPLSSSTSVPLPKVVDLKPKSSTGVLTTIIGLAKTRVFILIVNAPISYNIQLYKTNEETKQTNKKQMFRFSNISCITNQYHLLLVHTKQRRRNKPTTTSTQDRQILCDDPNRGT